MKYKGFTYTPAPKTAWDSLSMQEKSDMMKVAVRNGITDLKTIREKYNEFAGGGYLDWKEKASKYKHLDIDNDITYDYEGWYNENPQRAWDFLNDSPDAHFDDKYKTVYHPTFSTQSKYSGKKDAAYNPLGLVGGTWDKQGTVFTMSPDGYRSPVSMDERKWYLENAEDNGAQLREADGSLPVFDGIPWGGVLPNVTVTGNRFAEGGGIHIKPSHRGRLTELKKRTGKTEAELYRTGSPATRKMITFARNARKWKHGLGGNLFDGTTESSQQMQIGRPFWQSQTQEPSFIESLAEFNRQQEFKKQQQRQALRERIDTVGKKLVEERMRDTSVESNDNAWVDTPLTYKKKNPHLSRRAEEGAKAHAAWEKEHPNLTAWSNVAGALPFAIAAVPFGAGAVAGGDALAATTAGQAITSGLAPLYQAVTDATIAGAPALAWADAGLTSAFGAHGISHAVEEGGISPMTALDIAPLGRVVKPMYEGIVQPGMRLFNSPLTGNWTKIGNREYRLNPNSLGTNGSPLEARSITPQITAENAASITPEQWTAAQDAAIARGDMTEAQRLRDLHFKVSAPNSAAVGEDGFPLSLLHGTRTAKGIRKNGFSKAMSGKGNRGADEGNIYLTNNYENAVYTGIKAHEVEPLIDKVNSVYDLFGSETIPSLNQIYSQADNLSKQSSKINEQLYKLHTGTVWDKISTSLGLKNSPSNRAKKLQSIIDSNNRNIDELNRRAHIVGFLDDGLSFIGGNRDRTVVNTLNFIKEPVNPTSPYRQIAADRTINAMYGTTDQIYSPEVLRLYGNFESPLLSDFKMSPTDINPLKADKWSQIRVDYNNREKALLQELASPQYDSSISKNKFDVLFGNVYIAKKPNSLKLADAVTYDNNGVRIPLGDRDNFNMNDIRYGLLPFGIGLTGYGLWNKNE